MWRSLRIGGSSSVQWRKVGRSWRLRMCFRRLLCVRIEIDQLQCVNCWVIIHCLSVSCTTINHSRYALVIWSSLQLTSKQWIITQQFTAGADIFLNSFTSVSRYITSPSRYHPRYQSRSSMYIYGLIPRNSAELAEAFPIEITYHHEESQRTWHLEHKQL